MNPRELRTVAARRPVRNVTILGTGIMGAPMARNLRRAGFTVRAWNRTHAKAAELTEAGVQACTCAEDAVSDADCVIVMLSTGDVIDQVLFEETASGRCVATQTPAGAVVVVMSSIPVSTARTQSRRLAERGLAYVDAPVSGGERGAIDGTLTIMAGGSVDDIAAVDEVLCAMGRVTRVGPVGSGQLAKLANQVIVGVTIGAVAEALLLAESGGADLVAVRAALLGGFADSTVLRQHGERMVTGNFQPGAHCRVQLKDLHTANALARELGIELPISTLLEQLYVDACRNGHESQDHSALYLELRDRAPRPRP